MSKPVKLKAGKQKTALKMNLALMQRGACCLCGKPFIELPDRDACLDHNHVTGACRGVLCRNCNGIEGRIVELATRASRGQPPVTWLKRLSEYHQLHKTNQTGFIWPAFKTQEEKRLALNAKARRKYAKNKKDSGTT